MRSKRLLCGTAAFILAAVLLSTQLPCRAGSSLSAARLSVLAALEEIGFSASVATPDSTLAKAASADYSLLDNSCVIGHSHAVGMQMALDMIEPDYIAEVGIMTERMLVHGSFTLPDGSIGSLRRGLEGKSYERIFVLLGTNDMVGADSYLPVFKSSMETLLDAVAEWQPDAEICLLSIAPISKGFYEYCYYNHGLTRETMDDYNRALRSIAMGREIDFLDITTPLSDEKGYLAAAYDRGDGLHFNAEGNRVILDTIMSYLEG